jgi:hypothetical protein
MFLLEAFLLAGCLGAIALSFFLYDYSKENYL